jgi:hypothetical protein
MLGLRHDADIRLRSSELGRLTNPYSRWFAIGIAAIVVLVAIGLAFVPWPAFLPDGRGFVGTLDRSLITPVVLAAAAYFYFYFLTAHRATRELLRVAQQTPERLFPYSPEAGSAKQIFGRDRLVKEIADGMHSKFGAGPQIVVGDTGSGKTTLLLALASQLAEDHFILPIVLSLRDSDNDLEKYDFAGLAVKRFGTLVDPYIKTEAEADKLWRWMCKKRRIVVLADDLDRGNQAKDPNKTQIRLALDKARVRNLPLVVTTRPAGLPPDLREPPIDLSDWSLEGKSQAARYVMRRASQADRGDDVHSLVEESIEAGELLENAFYLTLLTRLLRIGKLKTPSVNGKHAVRVALLDADRERLCGEGVMDPEECRRRDDALRGVESLAAAWLVPKEESGSEPRWANAVRDGERFGLLSLDEEEHPQFKHEVLHAYFASRAIAAGDSSWKESLAKGPNKARVQLALVLTAARGECDDFCREVSEMLLADSPDLTPDLRLLRTAAAAEIGRAGSFSGLDAEIAASCIRSKRDAGPVAKRAALEQLEALEGESAVEALWFYAHDEEYSTRWAAVERLVRRCSRKRAADGEGIRPPFSADAYEVVDPKIGAALDAARPLLDLPEDDRPDDWDPRIVVLKQLAWMLPALRTGAREPELRKTIEGRLDDLLAMERGRVTLQRGLEASVAQGFKADAKLHPCKPPDPYAEEMLRERAVFWYSQLNLVHALALRMAKNRDSRADSLASIVAAVKRRERAVKRGWRDGAAIHGDLHPMLSYAAKLCVKALKGDAGPERFRRVRRQVWGDEGVVVSGRPRRLDRAAAQLVGEITVLLNLNETGSSLQRREFGEEPTMPHCLQASRRRRELQDGCSKDCRFRLCPFQPARDEPSAHREISRAFCRDQRLHASPLTARRWGSRVIPGTLPEFWRWLEAQARF